MSGKEIEYRSKIQDKRKRIVYGIILKVDFKYSLFNEVKLTLMFEINRNETLLEIDSYLKTTLLKYKSSEIFMIR